MSRPTIDEILMAEAWLWSLRGTCSRREVGAVVATTRGVTVTHGYNGALAGMPHCAPHEDHQPCETSEHAERNAIYFAARRGVALEGCTLYSTDSPCVACARAVVQCGITRVVFERSYRDDRGLVLLMAADVAVDRIEVGLQNIMLLAHINQKKIDGAMA